LEEEKDALGSESVKYFGIKFESYKVMYFIWARRNKYLIEAYFTVKYF
jgi:hypothetical protein